VAKKGQVFNKVPLDTKLNVYRREGVMDARELGPFKGFKQLD
jgi:hypothetical protein